MSHTHLEVVLRYNDHTVKKVTEITVFLGPLMVAYKTLGGIYSEKQAIAEFKRNHTHFTRGLAYDAHQLPFRQNTVVSNP